MVNCELFFVNGFTPLGANVRASKLAAKMDFTAEIYATGGILSVTSAHHKFNVDYLDDAKSHAKVSLSNAVDLVNDFEMEIALENPHVLASPCEIGSSTKGGFLGMHCVTASFLPSITQAQASDGDKCEIIFVLDRSGKFLLCHCYLFGIIIAIIIFPLIAFNKLWGI